MGKKLGRPRTPASKAKTVLLGALFDPQEAEVINAQIRESGLDKSKWLRKATLNAARPVWIICEKWGADDLRGKSVEFEFKCKRLVLAYGLGRFFVMDHRDGVRLAIEIHGSPPIEALRFFLNKPQADAIARHADSKVSDFSCFVEIAGLQRLGRV